MLKLEEKAIKALHTRANLRRFIELVRDNNVQKVTKMCNKGMDPNYHCSDTGGKSIIIIRQPHNLPLREERNPSPTSIRCSSGSLNGLLVLDPIGLCKCENRKKKLASDQATLVPLNRSRFSLLMKPR